MSLPDAPPPEPGRYSVHGGPALDARVDAVLEAVSADLRATLGEERLDALVLGGGYGRGEGGVLRTPDGPRLFNDLDLVFVHHHQDESAPEAASLAIGRIHAASCGIHVDVTPLHRDRLSRLPPALTWYELAQGHHLVWGRSDALEPLMVRSLAGVHPTEWGRLLTNRAFGVALSLRLRAGRPCPILAGESPVAAETRHVQKAWLALGDVRLADLGRYTPLVQERATAFEETLRSGEWAALDEAAPDWAEHYRAALRFKLLPSLDVLADQEAQLASLSRLLAEELRRREASPPRPLVGLFATLRFLPPRRWLRSPPWRHPRERMRLGLIAELEGDDAERDRLCGSEAGLDALWQSYG